MEGEVAAFVVQGTAAAQIAPDAVMKKTDLNPWRTQAEMSEAMRKHLEGWEKEKWRAMVLGARDAGR